jgi:uncharacterized RDD family membrane protein YckC
VNQQQDSAAAPGQVPGPAVGQPDESVGAAGQAEPEFGAPGPGVMSYGQTQPGYGTPGNTSNPQPGYGTPGNTSNPQPGYGTPGNQAYPGYGTPGNTSNPQPGYGTPGNQAYPGYGTPGNQAYPGYGTPGNTSNPQPGYGTPGNQAYPGYGTPGNQAYPSYPQPGYGQPYQPYGYQPTGKDPALAEWWRRLLARVIDGLILAVVFSPLWIPPWHTFFNQLATIASRYPAGTSLGTIPAARNAIATAETHLEGKLFVVGVVFYLVAFGYDWIQHWLWGQTIGKRALGTKVVRDDGNPTVGPGPAAGRGAIYALTPVVPFVGWLFDLVNELWLTWDPRRQCLHDKAAHTVVIKKDYQLSRPQAGTW